MTSASYWAPQPGPQVLAIDCPVKTSLFGGSRGGGKSDTAIGRHILGAQRFGSAWNGLITRRKYKEFGELRRRWDEIIDSGLPAKRFGGDQQLNVIRFDNGARVQMPAIERLSMARDWVGHQFTEITIEEATTFPFFADLVDILKGSLRSPHGVPTHIFCTGNPGGPGHSQVKEFFRLGSEWESQGYRAGFPWNDAAGQNRVFIKSFLKDNLILQRNDPDYVKVLLSIADPMLRKAWIDGDWDIFIGQAFSFVPAYHVIKPHPIPTWAPLYMTFDWGFGAPFSIGWWYIDNDGRVIRCGEWYGWDGNPGKGVRMEDSEIAKGIVKKEYEMGIHERKVDRIAGPDCFSRKPNYQGGGQGMSTAEVFKMVDKRLELRPGDPDRALKIRQFRERLKWELTDDGKLVDRPMMQAFSTCRHFIRTIPELAIDEDNVEDIDCFVAGTLISTPRGDIPIENIQVGDFVETPIGPRKILKSGLAGYEKTLLVNLGSQAFLEGTYDHKIFIKNHGLLPLCRLSTGDKLITKEELCEFENKFSKALSLESIRKETILNAIQAIAMNLEPPFCTGRYGKRSLARFLMDSMSIIKTEIHPITILKTLNYALRKIMRDDISKKECATVGISKRLLRIGEKASKEKRFFGRILKNAVKILPSENLRALIVANILQQNTQTKNIAPESAKRSSILRSRNFVRSAGRNFLPSRTKQKKSGPVVISVDGRSEKKPVYYLTVDQAHLFYANGVLSANTDQEDHVYDEACHIAMARPLVIGEEQVRKQFEQQRKEAERSELPRQQQEIWTEIDQLREELERMDGMEDDWEGRVGGRVV